MTRSLLLDVFRIGAITLVFMAHFGQLLDAPLGDFFGIKNFYYVSLGGIGVTLFLVLSGLLAGLTDAPKRLSYGAYLLKKARRIYPLYWLTLPLSILGYWLSGWLLEGDGPALFPNGAGVDVLGSVTGFYAWWGMWGGPYNPPSWFIGLILSMYAVFPLLAFCMKRRPHLTLGILFLVSVLSRWYVGQYGLPWLSSSWLDDVEGWVYRQFGFMPARPGDWFPLCRVFEFGAGMWLAMTLKPTVWSCLNVGSGRLVAFFSDLAFPMFLLHYPYLFLVQWMTENGMPVMLAVGLFMVLLTLGAYGVSRLESRLLRKRPTT
ncbi:acyltransferase family protein [Salinispirillum marinum]|uniref:Acyltransferase family protein n=2 Tax=Saccharospirillaceae TaxID=255527 RepID=A0ABV8BCL4_9GAMM